MASNEVLNYIKAQIDAGVSRDAITQKLLANGWDQNDINQAFASIDSPQQQTTGQTVQATQQVNNQPQQIHPKKKSKLKMILIIIAIIFLLSVAYGGYGVYKSYQAIKHGFSDAPFKILDIIFNQENGSNYNSLTNNSGNNAGSTDTDWSYDEPVDPIDVNIVNESPDYGNRFMSEDTLSSDYHAFSISGLDGWYVNSTEDSTDYYTIYYPENVSAKYYEYQGAKRVKTGETEIAPRISIDNNIKWSNDVGFGYGYGTYVEGASSIEEDEAYKKWFLLHEQNKKNDGYKIVNKGNIRIDDQDAFFIEYTKKDEKLKLPKFQYDSDTSLTETNQKLQNRDDSGLFIEGSTKLNVGYDTHTVDIFTPLTFQKARNDNYENFYYSKIKVTLPEEVWNDYYDSVLLPVIKSYKVKNSNYIN